MKTIYGLMAKGRYNWCGGIHTIICKCVFTDKQKALDYMPIFKQTCIEPHGKVGDMCSFVDDNSLTIKVIEQELHED